MNSRNYIKTQKSAISVKKNEDKHAKDKKYCKVRDHYHYAGECIEIPIVFQNGCNMIVILSQEN